MRISFDLDSTLIPNGNEFPLEAKSWLSKMVVGEGLRKGTSTVFKELQKHHSIHVYTTSYRSAFRIRLLFLLHGLRVGEIINQKTNKAVLSSLRRSCSKYPPAFDFDLHVDDSKGVQIEGVKHGFKVVHVKPTDTDWTKTVLKEIESFVEETH